MPVMDGFVATRILKEKMKKGELPNIPIIAHTAYSTENDNMNKKLDETGFDAYLPKPFTLPVLKEKLGAFLKLWFYIYYIYINMIYFI